MVAGPQAKWDGRYRDARVEDARPPRVLTDYAHLLPAQGQALDLACGLGGGAQFLAGHGLTVQAWDLSPVATEKLAGFAAAHQLAIVAEARDLIDAPPPPGRFDVILVAHFLERTLAPHIAAALRPGGLLFYQTFSVERHGGAGPTNPALRLQPNELLTLFAGLRVLAYREDGLVGNPALGVRNEALLVAQRPVPAPAPGG